MANILMKAGMGAALAATAIGAAAPAEAQRWRHRDRGGDVAAGALVGGILGLGIGAAIASNNRNRFYDGGGYYDRGYYDRNYYAQPYFYDDYRYNYRPRCWRQWRWDPYYGGRVPVRVCR